MAVHARPGRQRHARRGARAGRRVPPTRPARSISLARHRCVVSPMPRVRGAPPAARSRLVECAVCGRSVHAALAQAHVNECLDAAEAAGRRGGARVRDIPSSSPQQPGRGRLQVHHKQQLLLPSLSPPPSQQQQQQEQQQQQQQQQLQVQQPKQLHKEWEEKHWRGQDSYGAIAPSAKAEGVQRALALRASTDGGGGAAVAAKWSSAGLRRASVRVWRHMFSRAETARVYAALWTLSEWEIKTITILGKQCSMHRELCTFGSPGTRYSYGNDTHVVHPFTEEMEMVRARVEESLGNRFSFNLCLLNKYRSGNDYGTRICTRARLNLPFRRPDTCMRTSSRPTQ